VARILIRAHKHPLEVASAEVTLGEHLIGNNVGNLVFSQAVFRLLSVQANDLATAKLTRGRAGKINAKYDHVVIPLANAFRRSFLDQLEAMTDIIEKLTVPVTVVGVGAQAPLTGSVRGSDQVNPAVRRFVRAVLRRSPSIGVRGEFTQRYLRDLGFGPDEIDVIGCPSMFMYGPDLAVSKRSPSLGPDSRIALNISPYVKAMGPVSLDHATRYPRLDYLAQDHLTLELLLYGTILSGTGASATSTDVPVTLHHPLIREDRVRFFLDPRTWIDGLRGYDFSFGTRIHGNIVALLAGTPAVVLAHDARTLELAEYHQIPRRTLTDPDAIDAAELYASANWAGLNAGHAARWATFAAFLARHDLSHAYQEGQSAAAFDAALAAASFPPPVHTLMGADPEELYALKRALRETKRALSQLRSNSPARNGSGLRRVRRWVTAGLRRARQVARR
jgi:Polysaccharide pyruvyl transferase